MNSAGDTKMSTWTDRAIAACEIEFNVCAKHQTRANARKLSETDPVRQEMARQAAWHWGHERGKAETMIAKLQKRAQRRAEMTAWLASRGGR
jgi:hypothetical protein